MSKYFSILEFTRSSTAAVRGIDNTPPLAVTGRLQRLIDDLLDPVRERWGRPITVNSGYRCPELNKAVGGVPTSQHCKGEAADITAGSPEKNRELFEMIRISGLQFDQLIDESHFSWVHISYSTSNRRQVLHL